MLTLEDIISDMCEGQYANKHKNAASKVKIPPQLWFVDVVLQKNACPLGHKTQRRDIFLAPYICSIEVFGAPFPRSFGGRYINSRRECTTELPSLLELGVCLSLFSSLICFERRD
jgi:hypothetical protein